MDQKQFERLKYLEGIDAFGERFGEGINKSTLFVWSKLKWVVFAISAGGLVLVLSMINGLTGRNKKH